ncbi:hypothetical protein U6B65_07610 [Oscillospiraceae bacterium MB08-C2-2]|nr:hypothetical protein U6B65_07610 [Oscillospiraceae bacterium MB08-C2-2]
MNKKCRAFLGLSIAVLLLSTGCSTGAQPQEAQSSQQATKQIYGKITTINGNEITLKVGTLRQQQRQGPEGEGERSRPDRSQENASGSEEVAGQDESRPEGSRPSGSRPEGAGGEGRQGRPGGNVQADASGEEQPASPDGQQAVPEDGEQGGPEGGQGRPGGQGGPGGGQGGMRNTVKLEYTGEETTWLIPVSATITAGEGDSASEVRFTQLAVDNIVCLTVPEEDPASILSVQVLQ